MTCVHLMYLALFILKKVFWTQRLLKENLKLKNNRKKINIPKEEGVYVWHYSDEKIYRIGKSKNIKRRMSNHGSSLYDNPIVDYHINTCCDEDFEKMVMISLKNYRYRNDRSFFECDLNIIKDCMKKIKSVVETYRIDCILVNEVRVG